MNDNDIVLITIDFDKLDIIIKDNFTTIDKLSNCFSSKINNIGAYDVISNVLKHSFTFDTNRVYISALIELIRNKTYYNSNVNCKFEQLYSMCYGISKLNINYDYYDFYKIICDMINSLVDTFNNN